MNDYASAPVHAPTRMFFSSPRSSLRDASSAFYSFTNCSSRDERSLSSAASWS